MVSSIETLEQATAWLEGLINMERSPRLAAVRQDLRPIEALLARLGHPERDLSIVHVAGSKGKGSTCLLVEAVLRAAGERVATFTSPHLVRWTERFRVDGEEVDGAALARAVASLAPHVEALRDDPDVAPTFFDATTAAALLLFREAGVDRVVLEVGLGGRLDSTNAVSPVATAVTSIELEHTDKLGDTLALIAAEKAGILKPGIPCAMGRLPDPAAEVVVERARTQGAPLRRLGVEFDVACEERDVDGAPGFALEHRDGDFTVSAELATPDRHQVDNASVALALARMASPLPEAVLAEAAARALPAAALPGRCEIVRTQPWIVIDGAHTEVSARGLARSLRRLPSASLHLVLSVSEGKSVDAVLAELVPLASRVTVTRADPVRSLPCDALAERVAAVAPDTPIAKVEDPRRAVVEAARALGEKDALCVAGSIYQAGHAREALRSGAGAR